MEKPELICIGCGKKPEELDEYVEPATAYGMTIEDYIWEEEGTLNKRNGHFLCTPCYVRAGMPTAPRGWKAP